MSAYDFQEIQRKLKKKLDEERYQHTLGVMYTSASLAMAYGYDLDEAQAAGLLHDCAKCIPNTKKLKLCEKKKIPVTDLESRNPYLLHTKLGAYLARKKYGVDNEDVLSAILYHTTGRPEMTVLEKIVYIADYIEPLRDKAPHLERVRRLAFQDLDECMYEILKDTLEYLEKNRGDVDQITVEAYKYYEGVHLERLRREKFNERRKRYGRTGMQSAGR